MGHSVEHGYRQHGQGTVELYASREDGVVVVTVVDHG
jgi:anti-sigma regulatory factor (Ser/Thr protein kinase)